MGTFEIKKENGKLYLFDDNGFGTTYKFEVVDSIPAAYDVWNIPDMIDDYMAYVPLINRLTSKADGVDVDTLKAIPLLKEDAKILHDAASYGIRNIKDCEKALSRVAKSSMMRRKQERSSKALPILKSVTY